MLNLIQHIDNLPSELPRKHWIDAVAGVEIIGDLSEGKNVDCAMTCVPVMVVGDAGRNTDRAKITAIAVRVDEGDLGKETGSGLAREDRVDQFAVAVLVVPKAHIFVLFFDKNNFQSITAAFRWGKISRLGQLSDQGAGQFAAIIFFDERDCHCVASGCAVYKGIATAGKKKE